MDNPAGFTLMIPADEFGRLYPLRGESARPALPCRSSVVAPEELAAWLGELGLTSDAAVPPVPVLTAVWAGCPVAAWLVRIRRPAALPENILPPMLPAEAVKLVNDGVVNDLFSLAALLRLQQAGLIEEKLEILYQDDYCAAVHKPAGMLVHRQPGDPDRETLLRLLRNQLGRQVQPVHRLDKPTSGIVLFALDRENDGLFHQLFQERSVDKVYRALVRGYTEPSGVIDYPVKDDRTGALQDAVTTYRRLAVTELPIPVGRYQTARYSLVEVRIETGRTHQIRKHFAHLRHPLIGDTQHGDTHHNRMFREKFNCYRLLLAAVRLEFVHPLTNVPIVVEAAPDFSFSSVVDRLAMDYSGAPFNSP